MTTTTVDPDANALIQAVSVNALIAARDNRIALYKTTRQLYRQSNAQCDQFDGLHLPALRIEIGAGRYSYHSACDVTDAEIELETDRAFWQHLFKKSNITTVMNYDTKEKLSRQLADGKTREEIPELTAENIYSTFSQLFSNRRNYLEDAVDALYRRLNFDYKTNTPRLIGEKVIIEYGCRGSYGGGMLLGNYQRTETIFDLEMVLCQLSGSTLPTHQFGARAMKEMTPGEWYTVPAKPAPLMQVKCFCKQTVHVRFLDRKPVDEMNRIISRRYPHAIPAY